MGGHIAISLTFILCCSISYGEDSRKIPLSEIWSYGMPGTRDMRELSNQVGKQAGQPKSILAELAKLPPEGKPAIDAFTVRGTGLEAFRNSIEVLVDKKRPERAFTSDMEITIAFFSYGSNWYVHLQPAELKSGTITINYNMILHETEEATAYFALIPLGKLPSGKYQVEMIPTQLNTAGDPLNEDGIPLIVNEPFSFTVKERK